MSNAQPTEPQAGTEVVLVVEDEVPVRTAICRTLRKLGYYVLEAGNGEQALTVMQDYHSPVHLVITDIIMPEMEGTELVALLRDWYPRMRALFISGYSQQDLEARGNLDGGAMDGSAFLAKPFSLDVLAGRVRELLDEEWSEAT
jgi:two-component system cell cycle sensor histidine kinase/response regulator CckA